MASIVTKDAIPCRRRREDGKDHKCRLKDKITVCRFNKNAMPYNRGKFAPHKSCGLKKKS